MDVKPKLLPKMPGVEYVPVVVHTVLVLTELGAGKIAKIISDWSLTPVGREALGYAVDLTVRCQCHYATDGFLLEVVAEMPEAHACMWLLKYSDQPEIVDMIT